MKKLANWFNHLPTGKKQLALVLFCLVFAILLLLSIEYQSVSPNNGQIIQPRIQNN